jgi:hypothetical protein
LLAATMTSATASPWMTRQPGIVWRRANASTYRSASSQLAVGVKT